MSQYRDNHNNQGNISDNDSLTTPTRRNHDNVTTTTMVQQEGERTGGIGVSGGGQEGEGEGLGGVRQGGEEQERVTGMGGTGMLGEGPGGVRQMGGGVMPSPRTNHPLRTNALDFVPTASPFNVIRPAVFNAATNYPAAATRPRTGGMFEQGFGYNPSEDGFSRVDPNEGTDTSALYIRIRALEEQIANQTSMHAPMTNNSGPRVLIDTANRKEFHFSGVNVSSWLESVEIYYRTQGLSLAELCQVMLLHVDVDLRKKIQTLVGYVTRDWARLKRDMKETFTDERTRRTVRDFDALVKDIQRKQGIRTLSSLDKYGRKFSMISDSLIKTEKISWQEESRAFLSLFPRDIRQELEERRKMFRCMEEQAWLAKNSSSKGLFKATDPTWSLLRVADLKKHARVVLEDREAKYDEKRVRKGKMISDSDGEDVMESEEEKDDRDSDSDDERDSETRKHRGVRESHDDRMDAKRAATRSHHLHELAQKKIAEAETAKARAEAATTKEKAKGQGGKEMDDLVKRFADFTAHVTEQTTAATYNQRAILDQIAALAANRAPQYPPPQQARPPFNNNYPAPNQYRSAQAAPPPAHGVNAIPLPAGDRAVPPHMVHPSRGCAFDLDPTHSTNDCPHAKAFMERGIVTKDPSGQFYYRGTLIPPPVGHYKNYVEAQETRAARREGAGAPAFGANATSYMWEASSVSESGTDFHEAAVYYVDGEHAAMRDDIFDIEAKRTRSQGEGSQAPAAKRANVADDFVHDLPHRVHGPFTQPARTRANVYPPNPQAPIATGSGVPHDSTSTPPPPLRFNEPPALLPYQAAPRKETKGKGREDDDVTMKEGTVRTRGPAQHRLATAYEGKADPKEIYRSLLANPVNISLGDLLSVSSSISQQFAEDGRRKRVPIAGVNATEVFDSDAPLGANATEMWGIPYAGPLGFGKVTLYGQKKEPAGSVQALLDSGSQVNIISDTLRKELGLGLRTDGVHRMRGAGGTAQKMEGLCEFVKIFVGGLELEVHFYCMKDSNFHLLLGVPFLHLVSAQMVFNKDGSVDLGMKHAGKTASLTISSPGEQGYLYDVPGQGSTTATSAHVFMMEEECLEQVEKRDGRDDWYTDDMEETGVTEEEREAYYRALDQSRIEAEVDGQFTDHGLPSGTSLLPDRYHTLESFCWKDEDTLIDLEDHSGNDTEV